MNSMAESSSVKKGTGGLNLPTGMDVTINLNPSTPCRLKVPKTSSPSKTIYSDRFIPCRSSSRLQNFALVDKPSPGKDGGNDVYQNLLRAELFGEDFVVTSPAKSVASPISSPNKNMFRFKTDHSAPSSPFSAVNLGNDGGVMGELSTPPKIPRKISKTPHKVYYQDSKNRLMRFVRSMLKC